MYDRRKEDERVAILENEVAHLEEKIKELGKMADEFTTFKTAFEASAKTTKWFTGIIMAIIGLFATKSSYFNKLFEGL